MRVQVPPPQNGKEAPVLGMDRGLAMCGRMRGGAGVGRVAPGMACAGPEALSGAPDTLRAVTDLLLDPDCRDGKHGSCVGGPCECLHHEWQRGWMERSGLTDAQLGEMGLSPAVCTCDEDDCPGWQMTRSR